MPLAAAWLATFCFYFFTFQLPNNPTVSRLDVWLLLPGWLLDLVLPGTGESTLPSGWQYLPQRFDLVLVAGVLLAGAWGLGHLLVRAFRLPLPPRSLERTVFALGLGLAALSLLTLALGLAGLLLRPLFLVVTAAGIAGEACLRVRGRRRESTPARPAPPARGDRRLLVATLAVAAPFLLAMALGSMLPSVDFDALEYHLQGPKEWYQQGAIAFLPHNVYTSFPFLTEMLTLAGMVVHGDWFRGALAGQLVLMTFAPLTALALYAAGRRWFSRTAGLLAVVVHLSCPWTYRISTIAGAEGGLTFYLFASLLAAMFAFERRPRPQPSESDTVAAAPPEDPGFLRYVCLTGLLSGSAMACKYPGVLSVVLPLGTALVVGPLLPLRELSQRRRAALRLAARTAGVFACGVALTAGPWLLKNLVQTGNPVYPLLYSVFGGRDWDVEMDEKWRRGHSPGHHQPADILVKLIDVTAKSDWQSPLVFGLAPLAFLLPARRRTLGWLAGYVGWLFLSWWLFTHRLDRFWVPLIPVAALLAGAGATWSAARAWRWVCGVAIAAAVAFNLVIVTSPIGGYNAFLVDLNFARQHAASIVGPEIALLNQSRLPERTRMLFVGEAEVFHTRFPVVYNTVFDRSIFQEWTGEGRADQPDAEWTLRDADDIRQTFRDEGITHVFVNWQEILRYRAPGSYGYTDYVTPGRFDKLQQAGVLGPELPGISGYRDADSLSPGELEEIERWVPELLQTLEGRRVFLTSQLFPVLRDGA